MPDFEIIDHTADIGIAVYGHTIEEIFVNAAQGMFSLIADLGQVVANIPREISVYAEDHEELLVTWLNELLYLCDAENLIFNHFEISHLERDRLTAIAYGEKIDPLRHGLKTQVKAATYYHLKLQKSEDGFKAQIIFDI